MWPIKKRRTSTEESVTEIDSNIYFQGMNFDSATTNNSTIKATNCNCKQTTGDHLPNDMQSDEKGNFMRKNLDLILTKLSLLPLLRPLHVSSLSPLSPPLRTLLPFLLYHLCDIEYFLFYPLE